MAEEHAQRKLMAILAADVVGYSRLIEADEEGTRTRLRSLHAELIDTQIAADGGRIVKTTGDGILVEFPSAVAAVRNALKIQAAMAGRDTSLPEESRIRFRVGINVGDVIIEGDDIHGDGVNVAARLEGLCQPGEVYVSGTVRDHVENKLAAAFDDLGKQTLKNIARPVRVFRVRPANGDPDRRERSFAPSLISDKPSIAVLPFDNLSDDPQQDYFSDGMAEDLITDISNISGLFVTARNSSFAFKGQAIDVKEVAEKLGVGHILEGSVRKMGTKLRVNAQLIDAKTGGHIWAQRYDGDMDDIFEFQDSIREQIVSALEVSLTPTDQASAERKQTNSAEAYDLFLRGRASYYRFTPEHLAEMRSCLEKAIEIDPNFADAYSYLSMYYFQGWAQKWPEFDNKLNKANELAERGVVLDGTSAIALTRLGWIQTFLRRHDQAVSNLEKAIILAPNNTDVIQTFGQILNYSGNPERGLRLHEKAFSIDTVVAPNREMELGLSHLLLKQYDKAIDRFRRAVERAPNLFTANLFLAWAYVELDQLDNAKNAVSAVRKVLPHYTLKAADDVFAFRVEEVRDRFLDSLRKAGLPE